MGSIPGLGRSPGGGNGNPLQYSCLKKRSLAGYSPKEHKESDTNEHTHMPFLSHIYDTHMINVHESSNTFYMNSNHSLSHHAHWSNSQLTNRNNQYTIINIIYL